MNYNGGKNAVYHHIINQFPPHKIYVELFFGSGAVMRKKKPAKENIGVEICPKQCAAVQPFLSAGTKIFNESAIDYLKRSREQLLSSEDVLIYADPPYLFETRKNQKPLYGFEFGTVEDHRELLQILLSAGSRVVISGYASSLYDEMLKGWRRVDFTAYDRMRRPRTESIWCNFPEPVELHDYAYLGTDRTDRQRIKRKKSTWKNRLAKMSLLERGAVLTAIDEMREFWSEQMKTTASDRNSAAVVENVCDISQIKTSAVDQAAA